MKDSTAASQTPNLDRARSILRKQSKQLEREACALAWLESRAPRTVSPRAHTRARGAGRPKAQATRSSARSGDSGEDGEPSSDPASEPPPTRRLCGFCGEEIPDDRGPKAEHCSDKHAANARQRRKRQRLVDEDAVGALLDWIMDGEGLTSEQERALHEPLAARMSRHLQSVDPPSGPWFLTTRAEIDAFFAERWATLSALMEAETSTVEPEQAQLDLGMAA